MICTSRLATRPRFRPLRVGFAAFLIATGCLAWLPASAVRGATNAQVNAAVKKAVDLIYSLEKKGNWEASMGGKASEREDLEGGLSALCTYALLAAEENPNDPRIQQAVKYLEGVEMTGVYAVGLRCQVWFLMGPPWPQDVKDAMDKDAAALMKAAHRDRKVAGLTAFYRYLLTAQDWDHSVSQYGVLGIWALAQTGLEIPTGYWQAVDYGWRAHQFADGGWSYIGEGGAIPIAVPGGGMEERGPTASMTAAGVATLFITQDFLHGMDGIDCPGNIVDPNIEAGLNWMATHFKEVYRGQTFYTLYGVERIGVASGHKYFGPIDWYKEGSDFLVRSQNQQSGAWPGGLADTCFSLLFLVRGRAPLVMSKLQYQIDTKGQKPRVANWNQRPRDAANITQWISRENEHFLRWQIINLDVPVEDLHDAPIIYIAGNQVIDLKDAEIEKLRIFVNEGGLIYANADCDNPAFSNGFKKLAHKIFPAYEWRDIPADSPIYTNEQFMRDKWRMKPRIEAVSNGARELMVLTSYNDPPRFWQTRTYGGHEELHQFMDDLFLYTVDRGVNGGVSYKPDSYIVRLNPAIKAAKTIKVARLQGGGNVNWDPEPGAWPRLGNILHNTMAIDLAVETVPLGEGKLDNTYKIADLTGTFKFTLSKSSRDELKKYVENGGTLIIDACGGDQPFYQSVEDEMNAIFPSNLLPPNPLAIDDPAYSVGPPLAKIAYRPWARKILGRLPTPRVRGMEVGKGAVYVSGEDLTCGVVGMPVDGIYGYDVASATTIMQKLVLHAATK